MFEPWRMRLDTSLSARRRSLTIVLFLAVTINYLDRQVFATLAPTLQASARWSEITYAYIQAAFKIAYAIGYSLSGALVDRFGVRLVYGLAHRVVESATRKIPDHLAG